MKKTLLLLSIGLCLGLSACEQPNANTNSKAIDNSQKPFTDILYDPILSRLVKYDVATGQSSPWDNSDNQVQYQFPDTDQYFIDGNSITNNFKLISTTKNTIEVLHEFDANEGVFPIAVKGDKIYVIHTYYRPDGSEYEDKRRLARYDINTKEILDFNHTSGLISKGVASDNTIYYAVYDSNKDTYDINKIALGSNELNQKPETVKSNLANDYIYLNGNDLCITDAERIVCPNGQWKKGMASYFRDGKLIQVYDDPMGGMTGVGVKVIDTNKDSGDKGVDNPNLEFDSAAFRGLKFDGDVLLIGTDSGLQQYRLK